MKKAKVYMYDKLTGILTEDENGFHFQYDELYIETKEAEPISLTLDMHLKNFSLLKRKMNYELCPAYDLVASELLVEGDGSCFEFKW